jgi:hypothetical protein
MTEPIRELKIRAEILHGRIWNRQPSALARLRRLPEFRAYSDQQLASAAPGVLRRECLAVIARDPGFAGWSHAKHVISGARDVSDFGTMLYPTKCAGQLNLWYREYDEAVSGRDAAGGYLLPYRRQFMVVQPSFIEALGLDPDAPEWRAIRFDWVRPRDPRARTRLYGELIAQLPPESGR